MCCPIGSSLWEVAAGQQLVHHDGRRRVATVSFIEKSPAAQRQTERGEVAGRHRFEEPAAAARAIDDRTIGDLHVERVQAAVGQRHGRRDRAVLHAGDGIDGCLNGSKVRLEVFGTLTGFRAESRAPAGPW